MAAGNVCLHAQLLVLVYISVTSSSWNSNDLPFCEVARIARVLRAVNASDLFIVLLSIIQSSVPLGGREYTQVQQ